MAESVKQRVGAIPHGAGREELLTLLNSVLTDLTTIKTQFNQLRTDYNANANIVTDTTATAITLNTTA